MQVIHLSGIWTLAVDFAAWLAINLTVSAMTLKMPDHWFDRDSWLYRTRKWENGGQIWQSIFRVRSWKERLPDGSELIGRGYAKKRLRSTKVQVLEKFIRESRRAELTHVLAAAPAILFFLWNPPLAGWIIIVFALAINAPCIIAQRYNRPRLMKINALKAERRINFSGGPGQG